MKREEQKMPFTPCCIEKRQKECIIFSVKCDGPEHMLEDVVTEIKRYEKYGISAVEIDFELPISADTSELLMICRIPDNIQQDFKCPTIHRIHHGCYDEPYTANITIQYVNQ